MSTANVTTAAGSFKGLAPLIISFIRSDLHVRCILWGLSAVLCLLQLESFKIRCHVDTFLNSPSYILPSADGDKYEGEFEKDLDEGNVT
jgi:hypothetical protein